MNGRQNKKQKTKIVYKIESPVLLSCNINKVEEEGGGAGGGEGLLW